MYTKATKAMGQCMTCTYAYGITIIKVIQMTNDKHNYDTQQHTSSYT